MRPQWQLHGCVEGVVQHRWYRQTQAYSTGSTIACDCERWTRDRSLKRSCPHTHMMRLWMAEQIPLKVPTTEVVTDRVFLAMQPLLQEIDATWAIHETMHSHNGVDYHIAEVVGEIAGHRYRGCVALNAVFDPTWQDVAAQLAKWAGYGIAQDIARAQGFDHMGLPPTGHFRLDVELARQEQEQRDLAEARRAAAYAAYRADPEPSIFDIANVIDLGDGRTPLERAEEQLQTFLGPLYPDLQRNGFLDISSRAFAGDQRVYRVVIDHHRRIDRRVLLFEHGKHVSNLCIVRQNREVPVQDGFLSIYMGLLVNEHHVLRRLSRYNHFPPTHEQNPAHKLPAIWKSRPIQTI